MIGNLVLQYKTPVNIMYANTRDVGGMAQGEMILQLPDGEIGDRMIDYLREKSLGVEVLKDYVE